MRSRAPSWLFTGVVVVVWAATLVWIGHREGWWRSGSRGFFWAGPNQQCLTLTWGAARVGWVKTERRVLPEGGWEVQSEAKLAVAALGAVRDVTVEGTVVVDEDQSLRSFALEVEVGGVAYTVEGKREGPEFVIRQGSGALWSERRIDASVAADMGVSDPLLGTGTALPPGGGTLKFLNPLTLKVEEARIRFLGSDSLIVGDTPVEARLLEVDSFGMRSHCWVDHEGRLLKARTALGIEAVAVPCSQVASASLRPLEAMRVITEGDVPSDSRRLLVRLTVPPGLRVASHRQTWAGDTLVSVAEELTSPQPSAADSLYFAPGPLVESDHPALVAKAAEIVSGEDDLWQRAVLLLRWVNGYLRKEPYPGLPSALLALDSRTGDCNEHAALFVALCRASGLAADMRAGIACVPGYGFGYHAWAAVHLGRWVEMDPTWGQELVDASHIALVEGTPEEHVDLALAGEILTVQILEAW